MAKEIHISDILEKILPQKGSALRKYHREINLVPDIKSEMIKTLKFRNLVFFLCIVIAAASAGVTAILGVIAGGQQLAINSKQNTIDNLSGKIASYEDLGDFLTIKDQLGNISTLTENKKVISRTFNILSSMIPTGADSIIISKLSVDLEEDQPTFNLEAQANAGAEPYIDYNVLDSFKKSMQYIHFDYGNYVDKDDNTIPAYCMIENGSDGATFTDPSKGIYAYWAIEADGCKPSENVKETDYTLEEYEGEQVVRIWRTPQYNDWYKEKETPGQPYMNLNGNISNVAHFKSACITYIGDDSQSKTNPKWTTDNQCSLVHDDFNGTEGINIIESSNGRDTTNELVLRFSAEIYLDPDAYQFENHHMLAIAPSGYRNVTDSYVQVQAMFGQRASDCEEGDSSCQNNTNNLNGGNNG